MQDDTDNGLQFEMLAAALRADKKQVSDLVEQLSGMLQGSLPDATHVSRDGWFMSSVRPIKQLRVKMADCEYVIDKGHGNNYTAKRAKVVKGVVLKNEDIPFERCVDELLVELTKLAERSDEARRALQKFVLQQ